MEELKILYEDNHVIVVVKPANVPTQSDITGDVDLLSMVKKYIKEKYNKPGEAYVGLVHRLDRPTGGVMVFAKNSKSAARLTEQFKEHTTNKTYYAVTNGVVKFKKDRLVNYIKKDEKENIVKLATMSEQGAKRAELEYRELENDGKLSLLEVTILTGRSHQIRVQLANTGFPLYGDFKYGKEKSKATKNLGLWAGKLSFTHPVTKEKMTFMVCPDTTILPWKNFRMEKYFSR